MRYIDKRYGLMFLGGNVPIGDGEEPVISLRLVEPEKILKRSNKV